MPEMHTCLVCGCAAAGHLCPDCLPKTDIAALCEQLSRYEPDTGANPLWEEIITAKEDRDILQRYAGEVAELLPSPQREYRKLMALVGNHEYVRKTDRDQVYVLAPDCIPAEALTTRQRGMAGGLLLRAALNDYSFADADDIAELLLDQNLLCRENILPLIECYVYTRRYDAADVLLDEAEKLADTPKMQQDVAKWRDESAKRRLGKANGGKVPYKPAPKEDKERVVADYYAFLDSLGIEHEDQNAPAAARKIPVSEYPLPVEHKAADFDSFVAFDLETTGRSSTTDSITEIGAIRVVNGQVVESKAFVFQELTHPLGRRIPPDVEALTGITTEMVRGARRIEQVFNDFADFIGDDILVGYNCMTFDSRFLVRAGRYARRIIRNEYFDVMHYIKRFPALKETAGDRKLNSIAEALHITNPQAHRALADAVTTARVYLALKQMEANT